MEERIFNIIKNEFLSLVTKIEDDFKKNYSDKRHNFLLSELEPLMTGYMVFVSSFESKSGNSLQRIARDIAKLRYGAENVPLIINPHNIPLPRNFSRNESQEQLIITNVNIDDPAVKSKALNFINTRLAHGSGNNRVESKVTHESIKDLLNNLPYDNNNMHEKPVDLAFRDETGAFNIMEIKAGGNLDSSNAPANAQKLLLLYMALNIKNTKPYFATYYHKDGENNNWSGSIKKYLNYPEMFLIGSAFWNKILPANINFAKFTRIYSDVMKEINLNARLDSMIKKCSE